MNGYSRTQIGLHWATLAALFVAFFTHDAMEHAFRAAMRGTGTGLSTVAWVHVIAGLSVLSIAVWRLMLRLTRTAPAPGPGPVALRTAAAVVHWVLYALMLSLPLAGAIAWFGGVGAAGAVHGLLFNIGLGLVGLHVAAALFHHYVLRDGLLGRMVRAA